LAWRSETLALLAERRAKGIKIHWQVSIQAARSKLNSHYTTMHPENENTKKRSLRSTHDKKKGTAANWRRR
jgi:hypothetical protein